jgi:DNA-binding NarL/FixJ family response regulator
MGRSRAHVPVPRTRHAAKVAEVHMLKKSEYLQTYGSRREPSKEQLRIAELVAQAYTNLEIARVTGSTERAVRDNLRSIYLKLGLNTRSELAIWYCSTFSKK